MAISRSNKMETETGREERQRRVGWERRDREREGEREIEIREVGRYKGI